MHGPSGRWSWEAAEGSAATAAGISDEAAMAHNLCTVPATSRASSSVVDRAPQLAEHAERQRTQSPTRKNAGLESKC